MKNPIPFLRKIALLEAISWLLLLGVAMPLKYVWHLPIAVSVAGPVHGGLFVVFCWALLRAVVDARWPLGRAAVVFVASLLPIVPFVLDRRMQDWADEAREAAR